VVYSNSFIELIYPHSIYKKREERERGVFLVIAWASHPGPGYSRDRLWDSCVLRVTVSDSGAEGEKKMKRIEETEISQGK
jgi:hypothetical protein